MDTKILITGGGEKVIALLDLLRGIKGIVLIGVCDVEKNSPGMKYARQLALDTSIDPVKFIMDKRVDIIIETSGSREFQKVLHHVTQKDVKIVDSKAAELFLEVAQEKEKTKRYNQLYLVDKLSHIFSAEYDTHNITRPIFELLKKTFNVSVEAVLIFGEAKNELIIFSEYDTDKCYKKKMVDYIQKDPKIEKDMMKVPMSIFTQSITKSLPKCEDLKSYISVPLLTKTRQEGILILASGNENAFAPEDVIILNMLADELALFIENERIKMDLAEAKSRLESTMYSMSEGVIALDEKFGVTLINPAAKILLGLEEVKLGDIIWKLTRDKKMTDFFKNIPSSENLITKEMNFVRGATSKMVKFFVAKIFSGLGKPRGWIVLLTDITREKQVDKMKSDFISMASHELRTPLAAIKESVMLILDGTAGEITPQQKKILDIGSRNIEKLTNLVNDLLDLSKIETGGMRLEKRTRDLSELIERALIPMELLAKENKLDLKMDLPKGLPKVECDAERVTQIIVNLVGNAIKFTPVNGKVNVKASKNREDEGDFLEISVKDTGMGIDKKDISRLFSRFGQLDSSLTRKPGSTGLGLAICKELVEMHGGRIWVESEPGKGATFSFSLPFKNSR